MVAEGGEGFFGGGFVAEDLAEAQGEAFELGAAGFGEAGGEFFPACGRGDVAASFEAQEHAAEEGGADLVVVGGIESLSEEVEGAVGIEAANVLFAEFLKLVGGSLAFGRKRGGLFGSGGGGGRLWCGGRLFLDGGGLYLGRGGFPLVVEVGLDFFVGGGGGRDAIFGDLDVGGPEDGVEDDFPEAIVLPAYVLMSAGEAEAAAFVIGAVVGPGDVLGFAVGDGFADVGIAAACAVGAFKGFGSGKV